jgi:small-conductance mechanosensitive channel
MLLPRLALPSRLLFPALAALLALALPFDAPALAQHGQTLAHQILAQAQPKAPAPAPAATGEAPPAPPAPAPAEPVAPPVPVLSQADQQEIEQALRPITQLKTDMEWLEKAVERNLQNPEELTRLRSALIAVFDGTAKVSAALQPRLDALRQQIEKLGPPPAKDAAPESAEIAAERARLNALASEIDGALKSTDVIVVRARQLRDTVQTARQTLFATQILKRSPSLLAPATWTLLADDLPGAWQQLRDALSGWRALAVRKWTELAGLLIGVTLLYALLKALTHWILVRRLDRAREQPPSFFVRAATIGWVAPLLAIPLLVAVSVLGAGLDYLNLLTREIGQIAAAAYPAFVIFVTVSALTRAILQPRRPAWRLVDLATPAAQRVTRTITGIAAVFASDLVLQEVIGRLYMPFSISVMETALASIAIAALMLRLVLTPFEPAAKRAPATEADGGLAAADTASQPVSTLSPLLIKVPLLVVALAILGLSLLGYIGLGRFLTQQVVVTGSVIAVVLVFHLAIRALLGAPGTGIKPFATVLEERAGLDPAQSDVLARTLSLLLNAGLALAAVPLVLVAWGYSLGEALAWLSAAVFGFQIGDFRLSIARILLAGLLFLALVFVTRLAQRWLDTGMLRSKRIDQGIANSIRTAVGYTGFIVAVLAAISYGGLDITNFAIVAGALSVGIGFGLQSIINNFVSGLILLVERPIKVGDRVAVKGQEGFVRRISVRSTEIETLDKASLIVPNSEFITSTVTNWTHRNALGTATVRVTAGYRSDPDQVRAILLQVAAESPLILQHPSPSVSLDNFGANGLEFSLGTVVPDVTKAATVQSELRLQILKAFRAAGIEMPFAQHDVHLRDLDMVRSILARLAEERARQAGIVTPDGRDNQPKK